MATAAAATGGRRRVLFVVDPLDTLKAYKDSSIAMMRETARRGWETWTCTHEDLAWEGEVRATALRIEPAARTAASQAGAWFSPVGKAEHALTHFDAVLMRKDPPFDAAYLHATHLLSAATRAGTRVFNDPQALRDHNEKLAITEFPRFTAPTLVSCRMQEVREFAAREGDIVVKPLDGMGGSGVFRIAPGDPNASAILETVTQRGERLVMAQRYLPEIAEGDKRILLVDGVPVSQALARVPRPGELRGNLAAGGIGRAQPLSARDLEIAQALGPVLAGRGLFLVGLDVIGDCLTEINVTSPTCFVEIHEQSGVDVAALFMDALQRRLEA